MPPLWRTAWSSELPDGELRVLHDATAMAIEGAGARRLPLRVLESTHRILHYEIALRGRLPRCEIDPQA